MTTTPDQQTAAPAPPRRPQTVAVDFDGVLHTYEHGWRDGTIYGDWVPGAVAALTELMQRFAVFVHTTRDAAQVAAWIQERTDYRIRCTTSVPASGFWNQQGLLLVTDRKLAAVAYIDDRAVRFESWAQALNALDLPARGRP